MSIYPNAARLPEHLLPVFHRYVTCEQATLTAKGEPITYPLIAYPSADGSTIDVSTGLTYPAKAERARRNPKTTLLFSNPLGSGLENPPTVLVYGMTAVRDGNLQANTDRYIRELQQRKSMIPLPAFILRRMTYYFARIWMETTPVKILWWENGDMDKQPQVWTAPEDLVPPASDPAPQGKQPGRWKDAPQDWKTRADYAAANLGIPVLSVVDKEAFPVSFRAKRIKQTESGFELEMPAGLPVKFLDETPACLTFHSHPEVFTGQENMVFMGEVVPTSSSVLFKVRRCPGDWSLPPRGLAALFSMMGNGIKLRPRVREESERRNQPMPKVNI